MRRNYWSCSKFADWLRGSDKPPCATSKGWRLWKEAAKETHPIRFWIVEEGFDYAQNFVMWPIDKLYELKYYINNRFVTRTHTLTAHKRDIPRGQWCDVGNRFLPCLFNELVDYVEIELAWWNVAWSDDKQDKYNTPFWAKGWFRWRTWRCKQAGLDNLDWQRALVMDEQYCMEPTDEDYGKPTSQAVRAQEILDLYTWWTEVRPKRGDPHDLSGWTAICDARRDRNEGFFDVESRTEEEREATRKALDLCHEIESKYEQEDEDMLIRLIKIRQGLWT